MEYFGGIEAGGTKFVCMVGSGPDNIIAESRFPTTTPEETLAQSVAFFQEQSQHLNISGIGVGSFGPIDLDPQSSTYGFITTTPKPGWAFTNVVGKLESEIKKPVAFDTDVNAAGIGEYVWGNPQKQDPLLYITIGTGIGLGIIVDGKPLHGLMHPEAGHMRIPHDWQSDPFAGSCPYHGDCFEGLACGPAMQKRWGQRAETLPPNHPAWELEARYIATALVNMICTLSPQRIVVGGGVMQQDFIMDSIRKKVQNLLNNYIQKPTITQNIEQYIVPPYLGGQAGVLGSIALAMIKTGAITLS
jgi:fructokinase